MRQTRQAVHAIHQSKHRYQKSLNRLLKVCYVPATSTLLVAFFSSFLLQPLTVLMRQTRQVVCAIHLSKHRYQKSLNILLKVCYVPATSTLLVAFFSSFLLQPLTVQIKQTRQPVHAVKQSICFDV
jgi:hypothetical protein